MSSKGSIWGVIAPIRLERIALDENSTWTPSDAEVSRIHERIRGFENAVRSSGSYHWMAVFDVVDRLNRPRLGVYLVKRDDNAPASPYESVGEAVDDLARVLRPALGLDLFYIPEHLGSSDKWRKIACEAAKQEYKCAHLIFDLPLKVAAYVPSL